MTSHFRTQTIKITKTKISACLCRQFVSCATRCTKMNLCSLRRWRTRALGLEGSCALRFAALRLHRFIFVNLVVQETNCLHKHADIFFLVIFKWLHVKLWHQNNFYACSCKNVTLTAYLLYFFAKKTLLKNEWYECILLFFL